MSKKNKLIALLLLVVIVGVIVYFVFFTDQFAPPWDTLEDEEKIDIFENWFAGQGSVYIRPGSNEFLALVEEVKALYDAAGIPWDEEAFIAMYEAANGEGSYTNDVVNGEGTISDRPGDDGYSISNRPGTDDNL